jgi:hypothetical protein
MKSRDEMLLLTASPATSFAASILGNLLISLTVLVGIFVLATL